MRINTFTDDALSDHDTVALRRALSAGTVSPAEVREAAMARAQAAAPLNAVVTWVEDPAGDGPFAGVPTFLKDNEDLPGYPTTFGSRAVPRRDAENPTR
ncbi:MAG: amidase, partial [Actinobacteria bacterium]|nr:amidase [Actinomycetota bacterium]